MSKSDLAVIENVNALLAGTKVAPIVIPSADPLAGTGSAVAVKVPNWKGILMDSRPGSATPNQRKWQIEHSRITVKGAAKLSMVEASNRRAKLEGKISA